MHASRRGEGISVQVVRVRWTFVEDWMVSAVVLGGKYRAENWGSGRALVRSNRGFSLGLRACVGRLLVAGLSVMASDGERGRLWLDMVLACMEDVQGSFCPGATSVSDCNAHGVAGLELAAHSFGSSTVLRTKCGLDARLIDQEWRQGALTLCLPVS